MIEWLQTYYSNVAGCLISGGFLTMILLANLQVRRELKSPKVTVTITNVSELKQEVIEQDEDGNDVSNFYYEVTSECIDENGNIQELITYEEKAPRVGFTKTAILHTTIFGKKRLISEKELKKYLNKDGKPEGGGVFTGLMLFFFITSIIGCFA